MVGLTFYPEGNRTSLKAQEQGCGNSHCQEGHWRTGAVFILNMVLPLTVVDKVLSSFPLAFLLIFCDCLLKDTESKEANVSLPHLNSSCISAGSVLPLSTAFLYILIFFEQRLYISLWYDMRDHDTCVLCVRMSLTSGSFSEATLFLCSLGLRRYGCLWVARCILASRFCIWSSFPLVHT